LYKGSFSQVAASLILEQVVCVFLVKETKGGDVLFGLGLSRAAHRHIYSFFTAIRAPLILTNIPIYTTFHPNGLFRP
jgi:hypothetical protein